MNYPKELAEESHYYSITDHFAVPIPTRDGM